jgi:hypothetical protein
LVYQVSQPLVRELEQAEQRRSRRTPGADDADLADARRVALGHREGDVDAVALERRDGGHHLGAVQAARQVLALDLLLGAVDQRAVEGQALADAGVLQRLEQRSLSNSFRPTKLTLAMIGARRR